MCFLLFPMIRVTNSVSLHDSLPISVEDLAGEGHCSGGCGGGAHPQPRLAPHARADEQRRLEQARSEEHTSELQSHSDLVCRLLLEKKNKRTFSKDLFDTDDHKSNSI